MLLTLVGKTYLYLAGMVTYYFRDPEEAHKKAKAAGKQPGCWYGGITLRSDKKGWAIYKDGKVVEMYVVMGRLKAFFSKSAGEKYFVNVFPH